MSQHMRKDASGRALVLERSGVYSRWHCEQRDNIVVLTRKTKNTRDNRRVYHILPGPSDDGFVRISRIG